MNINQVIKPDLTKIKTFIQRSGVVPDGVNVIKGKDEFSYKLKEDNEHGGKKET